MNETLSSYWQFLKRPRLLKLASDRSMLWKDIFWLLALDFVFAGLVISIYYLLLKFNLIVKYEEYDIFQWGFIAAMLFGTVLAPLCEELIFRWQLRKPKFSVWFVMISAIIVINSLTNNDYVWFFVIIFFVVAGFLSFAVFEKLSRLKAVQVFRVYYVFLFYYTAVIFGYSHMSNLKGLTITDPSFLIYISSQIFGGLSMGYIRIKYGIWYSVLMHACFNAIVIPIAWAMM